jgi:ABC-type transport system involved in multi-copper enzyme maturation permease subunit
VTAASRNLQDRLHRFFRRIFVDPLAVKELSGIARRWQTYVSRGLYVAVMGIIVWMFWSTMQSRGGLGSPSALAQMAHGFFTTFIILQMLVATFGGVSAGSDLITREVRNGTLGLLALTPLSSWRIAAGKWKSAMVQTGTGLICGIPVFAILVYLGGIGLWEFAYTFTLSAACAALGAALGLLYSTLFRAGYVATIAAILTLLGYCILPALCLIEGGEVMFMCLTWVHPLFSAIGAVSQGTFGRRVAEEAIGWIPTTLVVGVQVWLLLRWAASRIRVLVRDSGAKTTASSVPSTPDEVLAPGGTSAFARRLRGREGVVWDTNAILWKELSTRRLGAGTPFKVGMVLLAFFLFTTLVPHWGAWRLLMYWISSIIFLLVSLATGVSLFVTEREERKWDVLLSTPLESHGIVLAKLLAGLAGLTPLAVSLAGFWAACELLWGATLRAIVMNLVAVGLVGLLAYGLGALASLHARNQRVAFSSSFGVVVGLLFVVPILVTMYQAYSGFNRSFEQTTFVIGCTNPVLFMAHVSQSLVESSRWEGRQQYLMAEEEKFWPMFQVYVGFYSALIGLIIVWMMRGFDRATGRC